MNTRARIATILASTLLLWVAVAAVLVYHHRVELQNPRETPEQRQQHEGTLYAIAGAFIIFNGVMTVLRIRQVQRTRSTEP